MLLKQWRGVYVYPDGKLTKIKHTRWYFDILWDSDVFFKDVVQVFPSCLSFFSDRIFTISVCLCHWSSVSTFCHWFDMERMGLLGGARRVWSTYSPPPLEILPHMLTHTLSSLVTSPGAASPTACMDWINYRNLEKKVSDTPCTQLLNSIIVSTNHNAGRVHCN